MASSLQVFGAQVYGDVGCELDVPEKKLPPDVIDEVEPVNGVRREEGVSVLPLCLLKRIFLPVRRPVVAIVFFVESVFGTEPEGRVLVTLDSGGRMLRWVTIYTNAVIRRHVHEVLAVDLRVLELEESKQRTSGRRLTMTDLSGLIQIFYCLRSLR